MILTVSIPYAITSSAMATMTPLQGPHQHPASFRAQAHLWCPCTLESWQLPRPGNLKHPARAQVVLLDCATQLAALGNWGIGPQQLGQLRAARLLLMMHNTWAPQRLSVNYLAMEVRPCIWHCPFSSALWRPALLQVAAIVGWAPAASSSIACMAALHCCSCSGWMQASERLLLWLQVVPVLRRWVSAWTGDPANAQLAVQLLNSAVLAVEQAGGSLLLQGQASMAEDAEEPLESALDHQEVDWTHFAEADK